MQDSDKSIKKLAKMKEFELEATVFVQIKATFLLSILI